MNPKYGSLAALDESEIRNELPERLCRCLSCGHWFDESGNCDTCQEADEFGWGETA